MQSVNPFLPSWEYVPDGEPHVFGDRVYLYGSHDRFGAPIFCLNDYVCWSASINNLADWRYEGVIYRKKQDPANKLGIRCLYAPDVTQGPDGRFYLYYAFDFMGRMGVAVCDKPAGQYTFLGHVKFPDGHEWGTRDNEPFPFDPGVITDQGHVYLYSGFANKVPRFLSRGHKLSNDGGVVMELEPDMLTIKQGPKLLFPTRNHADAFENHAFFEASSIRKVDDKFCFVYSSEHNHELCYALSDSPMGPFVFGGTLVDLGDNFIHGTNDEKRAVNYLGNTHGGLLQNKNDYYIFYHRQTNRNSYCRQACAEKLERNPDGSFRQAEVTSCGLNGGALCAKGRYEARIACNLWSKDGVGRYDKPDTWLQMRKHPYFTQSGGDRENNADQYIANMRSGATAGFKYFYGNECNRIVLSIRGKATGKMIISCTPDLHDILTEITVEINSKKWNQIEGRVQLPKEKFTLYISFEGHGRIDLESIEFI